MMVLADDARPLEIQSRQATGEAKYVDEVKSILQGVATKAQGLLRCSGPPCWTYRKALGSSWQPTLQQMTNFYVACVAFMKHYQH